MTPRQGVPAGTGEAAGHRIRLARPDDLPALHELETSCFSKPWSAAALAAELALDSSPLLVAADGGRLAGYALLRLAAEEAELLRLGVRPSERGRGLGSRLVRAGLRLVAGRGASSCFLEVRRDNDAAVALYEGTGFRLVGQRPGYYPDGCDALLYARPLHGG